MKEIYINKYRISKDLLLNENPGKVIDKGNMFEVSHIHNGNVVLQCFDHIGGFEDQIKVSFPVEMVKFAFKVEWLQE